jgi:hypothetical protein
MMSARLRFPSGLAVSIEAQRMYRFFALGPEHVHLRLDRHKENESPFEISVHPYRQAAP